MDPFFTEEQLNNMSRENMMEVMRIMQNQIQKKETEVQLLKDKQKELEFMNAMLSEYYGAAEPPVRCGESHLSGLTEPLRSL